MKETSPKPAKVRKEKLPPEPLNHFERAIMPEPMPKSSANPKK